MDTKEYTRQIFKEDLKLKKEKKINGRKHMNRNECQSAGSRQ